uniref:F-box domain-containing protein n=1 Tax=Plectus sambesii TaxID=2011161 RepID=A0A914XC39_9BILA
MPMAAFETENARLQAENDQLRCALADIRGQIACGQLTGKLPDNFLEQFSQLPDRPLEQVLRFLPAYQVAQMRLVSRKFNQLIKKCSKTMPKKERRGSLLFKRNHAGKLTAELFNSCGSKTSETTLTGNEVTLSELLRLICFKGLMYFGKGLSAADEMLDQLSKAWLTIRPEVVVFSGDLSQTSKYSLRAFLMKVEPSVERLHFQYASNIGHNLLSDDVICAAGRLNGLMVVPVYAGLALGSVDTSDSINIGDDTLLSMADTGGVRVSSYFFGLGCLGITSRGILSFVKKWMNKWMKNGRPDAGANTPNFIIQSEWNFCQLTFYKCANVTPAAIEEVCGDLLKKENIARIYGGEMSDRVLYSTQCQSSKCRLEIRFNSDLFPSHFVKEPKSGVSIHYLIYGLLDPDMDDEDEDDDGDDEIDVDDYDGYDSMDYPEDSVF